MKDNLSTQTAMPRTIDQWRNMVPEAVAEGSQAQVLYCLKDARVSILTLNAEIDRLRSELAAAKSDIAMLIHRETEAVNV